MKNIIIIGRPRAGKSTLANMIADKFHYQIIRTDALRNTFKTVFPELNIRPHTAINSREFQMFCKEFLEINIRQSRNRYGYVMEGCEISVKDCKELYGNNDNLIYVLGQINITPEEMTNNIRNNDTELDWSTKMNDEEILEYCKNSIRKAKMIEKECKEIGLTFYDTSIDRKKVLEDILNDIEKNIY